MKKLCLTTSIALILSVLTGSVFAAVSRSPSAVSRSPAGILEIVDGELLGQENLPDIYASGLVMDKYRQMDHRVHTFSGILGGNYHREFDAGWVCYLIGLHNVAGYHERIRLQAPGHGPYMGGPERYSDGETEGGIIPERRPVWTFVYRVTEDPSYYPRVKYRCIH